MISVKRESAGRPVAGWRSLAIETGGDVEFGGIKPVIRLKGAWLRAWGFPEGGRVDVRMVRPGVLEMAVQP